MTGTTAVPFRALPCYPTVLGGVYASWQDGEGASHQVDSIDELGLAYQREKTAYVAIYGHATGPDCQLDYWPSKATVSFRIAAEDRDKAEQYIGIVRNSFPMTSQYDVFLSYSSDDNELAAELKHDLENKGLKCFMAGLDIRVSRLWHDEIRNALLNSKRIIILLTPRSINKPWVMIETGAAWILGKDLIPALVQISPGELNEPIGRYQARVIETNAQRSALIEELVLDKGVKHTH